MTSITSLCELACQVAQKKLEEKQIEEVRAAKAKYWKLPVYYDDDDDEERSNSLDDNIISGLPLFSVITPNEPVISTEEPNNSLSMGDEHLDTIPTTESDEFIKSGVENLIPIPSESEGIPEHVCDVPFHDNSLPLNVLTDQIKDFFESNKEFSLIDDDSFSIDDIDYFEASPPDSELVSSEVIEIVIPEYGGLCSTYGEVPPCSQRNSFVNPEQLGFSAGSTRSFPLSLLPIRENDPLDKLARLYLNKIAARHEIPISIICDRDGRFTSNFKRSFQKASGTDISMSIAYHPKING
nr:reverse transcriptase domain-containing protein [Tanacetum cinerariifolium]